MTSTTLENRTAFVTGGSSGMGNLAAGLLAADVARVEGHNETAARISTTRTLPENRGNAERG